jgi:hypothetical protein
MLQRVARISWNASVLFVVVEAVVVLSCISCGGRPIDNTSPWNSLDTMIPRDVDFFATDGAHADDIWIVGSRGVVLHWDGHQFVQEVSPTELNLLSVWVHRSDDVWAVGDGGIAIHWDGHQWQKVSTNSTSFLNGVSGVNGSDVWVAAADNAALHWDGGMWQRHAIPGNHLAILVKAPDDVWLPGKAGRLAHWQEGNLTNEGISPGTALLGIWSDLRGMWVVGEGGSILHLPTGTGSWIQRPALVTETLFGVAGAASGSIWMVGEHGVVLRSSGETTTLVPTPSAAKLYAVRAFSDDVWVVGGAATVLRLKR